jgi:hypothetical protein
LHHPVVAARDALEPCVRPSHCHFMADPFHTDPAEQDPRERNLARRSEGPAVSPWLIIGVIVLIAVAVYVISAVLV